MMKNIDIIRVMSSLKRLKPMQNVAMRFNEQTGLTGLMHLRALMDENPTVKVSCIDRTVMDAVISTQQRGAMKNRIYRVSGFYFVKEKILRDILKDVDAVYVDNIGIEGIMSEKVNIREEVAKRISNAVFTPNFIKEINERGLNPEVYLSELLDGTPSLQIDLFMDGGIVTSLTLDGFSGRIAVDSVLGDDLYVAPGQFQQMVMEAVEQIMERVTA